MASDVYITEAGDGLNNLITTTTDAVNQAVTRFEEAEKVLANTVEAVANKQDPISAEDNLYFDGETNTVGLNSEVSGLNSINSQNADFVKLNVVEISSDNIQTDAAQLTNQGMTVNGDIKLSGRTTIEGQLQKSLVILS